jgi:acetylornithine deacetylase/succinyl-diaminopimelate desuccinylase-like protein
VDDKGQLWLHVAALEAHLAVRGTLPVNVIVLAEGEEEVGSEHLAPFIQQHKERLACDAVVISDSTMFAPGIPSILSSLRGLAYFEINVTGPNSDLHSGMYGGAVVNPATALARILATFHDAEGRIAIPGFYDKVQPFPDAVRARRCAGSRSTRPTSSGTCTWTPLAASRDTRRSRSSGRAPPAK